MLLLIVVCLLAVRARAATYTVSAVSGSAAGSLSFALNAANTNPGLDRVVVALPLGAVIRLSAFLPTVTNPLELQGDGVIISGELLTGPINSVGLWLSPSASGSSLANMTLAKFPGLGVY